MANRRLDLTGQRFGRLTAIRPTDERQRVSVVWECRCDCDPNKPVFVSSEHLRSGNKKSCGCAKTVNLTGQRFGKLVAVRPTEKRFAGSVMWECQCDCGSTVLRRASNLRCGKTRSCGCSGAGRKARINTAVKEEDGTV